MARPRRYETEAEKQRAYRERHRQEEAGSAAPTSAEPEFVFDESGTTRASLGPRYAPEITDAEFADFYERGLNGEPGPQGTGRRVSALQMAWSRGVWARQAEEMQAGAAKKSPMGGDIVDLEAMKKKRR